MLRNGEPNVAADVVDVEAAEEGIDVELHRVTLHGVAQHVPRGTLAVMVPRRMMLPVLSAGSSVEMEIVSGRMATVFPASIGRRVAW